MTNKAQERVHLREYNPGVKYIQTVSLDRRLFDSVALRPRHVMITDCCGRLVC